MILGPRIFTVKGGQLKSREKTASNQLCPRIISYDHSIRQRPCQYNTEAVKELRKQNHQLRLKFQQIELAYSKLLIQSRSLCEIDNTYFSNASKSEKTQATVIELKGDEMKSSIIKQLDEVQGKNDFKSAQLGRLSQSRFQDEDQDIRNEEKLLFLSKEAEQSSKGQTQESEDIGQQLCIAFQQINELKTILLQVKNNSIREIERLKKVHEQQINRIQNILQEERDNNRYLNEVITKLKGEMRVSQAERLGYKDIKSGEWSRVREQQRWVSGR